MTPSGHDSATSHPAGKARWAQRARAAARLPACVAQRLLIAVARLYQMALSPLLGGHCRYRPTCSSYFIEAVQNRGALRGTLMGVWRILRCNPFAKGGYDPVDRPGGEAGGEMHAGRPDRAPGGGRERSSDRGRRC